MLKITGVSNEIYIGICYELYDEFVHTRINTILDWGRNRDQKHTENVFNFNYSHF